MPGAKAHHRLGCDVHARLLAIIFSGVSQIKLVPNNQLFWMFER